MGRRIPFVLAAVVNLVAGIWAGLIRMGWELPVSELGAHHGAIMVGGFLAALIALEKAIPLKKKWFLLIPLISAFSLLIAVPGLHSFGMGFLIAGSVGLLFIQGNYLKLYPGDRSALLMFIGAACLIVGNAMLLLKQFYPVAFPWWMAFLLFTITAERLELSKFLPVSANGKLILIALLIFFVVGLLLPFHPFGKYLSGCTLIGISIWMLRHDVIRIGLKKEGLTRFSAVALLAANGWLLLDGFLMMMLPDSPFSYDMLVHVFFIGYVFSMIFAHGPIILPGVLGATGKPFHPVLYIWFSLLQASLLLRISADALYRADGRAWSGIFSGIAILLYFISMVILTVRTLRKSIR
jgi:hypothetical protein